MIKLFSAKNSQSVKNIKYNLCDTNWAIKKVDGAIQVIPYVIVNDDTKLIDLTNNKVYDCVSKIDIESTGFFERKNVKYQLSKDFYNAVFENGKFAGVYSLLEIEKKLEYPLVAIDQVHTDEWYSRTIIDSETAQRYAKMYEKKLDKILKYRTVDIEMEN